MKRISKKLLAILPILPLMMANSPAKMRDFNYTDFKMTFVSQEETSEGSSYFKYNYHVENTGDGYIYDIMRYNRNYYDYQVFYPGCGGCLFNNQVIAPHSEMDFYYQDYQIDENALNYAANAYTEFAEGITLSGSFDIYLFEEPYYSYDDAYYGYFIDLTVNNLNENKYYYQYILNVKYDDVCYSIVIYKTWHRNAEGFSFYSRERLDLNKLTLQDTAIVVNQDLQPGYREPTLDTLAMVISLGVVIGGVVIFSAIYFPIKFRKKKNYENK